MARYILVFIGATIRWLYGSVWRTVFQRKKYTFNEYLNGPNDSEDWYDKRGHRMVNIWIAIAAITLVLSLII